MQPDQLLADIERYVTAEFRAHEDQRLVYHNLEHTREVVSATATICGHYGLSSEERFPILAAAWFHDLAWLFSGAAEHEKRSADIARAWLTEKQVPADIIDAVEGCILATRVPQRPRNRSEEIIADADLHHLGRHNAQEKSDLLRKENELISGQKVSGTDFRANSIRFLEEHRYFTDFARTELQPGKDAYLAGLKEKQEKKMAKKAKVVESVAAGEGVVEITTSDKKKKEKKPSRGVETLFRLTSRNNMDLSAMADNKAGIMISVNSIIISVILTVLLRKLEDQPHLVIPTLIMLAVNITTIIFSILATRPKIIAENFTEEDIRNRKINMLFFGHFQKLSFDQYARGMNEMLKEKDYLYTSLMKDIYYLGLVLGKKYRYLRISYTIFMYGLIISVAAFGLAVFLNSN